MTTISASFFLLAVSAAMMMTNSEQFMLCGSVTAGSALGSIFQVTRALITKSEMEVPRQLIAYRFVSHAAGGIILGTGLCLLLLNWFRVEAPLVLLGVAVGGLSGWMSERAAKRYEPKILDMLERTGRISRPTLDDPPYTRPPTVNLAPKKNEPTQH